MDKAAAIQRVIVNTFGLEEVELIDVQSAVDVLEKQGGFCHVSSDAKSVTLFALPGMDSVAIARHVEILQF